MSQEQTKEQATEETVPQKQTKQPPLNAKEEAREFFKTALWAVLLAVVIRTFLFEPFNIPSGSMKPNLLVGDYLFVQKSAYGYSRHSFPFGLAPLTERVFANEPKRGDIIVFKLPSNTSVAYIKRLIGMPGDTIQVVNGELYLNNQRIPREPVGYKKFNDEIMGEVTMLEYIQTLPDGTMFSIYEESDYEPLDNTEIFTVPEGHYFFMGDNRDNSQDSRVEQTVGFVPFENFVGRADFLFFSTNGKAKLFEFWKWPWTIRYSRLFDDIDPIRKNESE